MASPQDAGHVVVGHHPPVLAGQLDERVAQRVADHAGSRRPEPDERPRLEAGCGRSRRDGRATRPGAGRSPPPRAEWRGARRGRRASLAVSRAANTPMSRSRSPRRASLAPVGKTLSARAVIGMPIQSAMTVPQLLELAGPRGPGIDVDRRPRAPSSQVPGIEKPMSVSVPLPPSQHPARGLGLEPAHDEARGLIARHVLLHCLEGAAVFAALRCQEPICFGRSLQSWRSSGCWG